MDKQQAVSYIHQMLEQDHSQDEIVLVLVDQLHAPQDLVKKFVAQTASAYHTAKALHAEESKPTWLRQLQNSAGAPAKPSLLATAPVSSTSAQTPASVPRKATAGDTPTPKLPPWLQENGSMGSFGHKPITPSSSWQRDQREYVVQQLEIGRTYGDIADDVAARTGVASSLARQFVRETDMARRSKMAKPPATATLGNIPMEAATLKAGGNQPKPPRDPLQDPQLMEFILDKLGSSRKRSDVVMAVCERANLSWDEAERVVAQASIQKHSQGAVRMSEAMMFLGVLVIIGGFALAAAFGLPILAQYGASLGLRLPFNGEYATSQPLIAIALFTGGTLLVGFGAAMAYLYYHAAEEQAA